MYSMVVMLALSQSPALEQVRPDEARYGNQLQSEHNRLFGGRRNRGGCCNSGCGYSSGCCNTGCGYGGGYSSGCCNTGCATGGCATGGCATGGCSTGCADGSCGTGACGVADGCNGCGSGWSGSGYAPAYGGRRGLFRGRGYSAAPVINSSMSMYGPNGEAPATLIVQVPADAQLTVDGQATRSTGATRVLVTPPLQAGREFTYELKVSANGKEETRQVKVSAGQRQDIVLALQQ